MRPSIDSLMMQVAKVHATRACCMVRQVGCVLTNERQEIISATYNGRPRGYPNCEGSSTCEQKCEGSHAEINALLRARGEKIDTCYVTTWPCWHCTKSLLAAGVTRVCTSTANSSFDKEQIDAYELGTRSGIVYVAAANDEL